MIRGSYFAQPGLHPEYTNIYVYKYSRIIVCNLVKYIWVYNYCTSNIM